MKILKSWLQDYIKFDLSNEEFVDKMVAGSVAVDDYTADFDEKVIVGQILEIKPHPNADRLRIARVTTGSEEFNVVCGAANIKVGQKVPLALVGAYLGSHQLEQANIRGVESSGMLCAADELGLGEDHTGIVILDNDYEVGQPLGSYLGGDAVYELEVTPDRGDELSHFGFAREVAAVLGKALPPPEDININAPEGFGDDLRVIVEDNDKCLQYRAVKLSGIKVADSPLWLKNRLLKCGFRPINNIVDITNYIMLDLGQPLHAFDAGKIAGASIIVRLAAEGEIINTLDGQKRNLTTETLVIADINKPLAIAGIVGGSESEVTADTKEIILEAAEFNPSNIRLTAKKLGVSTDASYRFERRIDSGNVKYALKKAAKLITGLAGGTVSSCIVSAGEAEKARLTEIKYTKINNLLGLDLSVQVVNSILESLGFEIPNKKGSGNSSIAEQKKYTKVPSWRHDIEIWQDLAEEVGRIYGYKKVPKYDLKKSQIDNSSLYYKKEFIKDILVSNGLTEVVNYPFLSREVLKDIQIDPSDLLEVANPVQTENRYLRKSLLPGLLKSIAKNPSFDPIAIFETGNVFTKDREITNLGLAVSGKNAKKIIESAIGDIIKMVPLLKDKLIVRELTRDELIRYKIRKPITFTLEIPAEEIIQGMTISSDSLQLKIKTDESSYRPISRFPSVTRDLAFIVDREIGAEEIYHTIYDFSELINRVELFDEFVSDKIGKGKKNVAYHLNFQHLDRTLTDKEVNKIIDNIVHLVEEKYKAKLRQ